MPWVILRVVGEETKELSIPPNFIKSITHTIASIGAGNRVTVNLFDPTWGILDLFLNSTRDIVSGRLKIQYQYGWVSDKQELSELYESAVFRINPGNIQNLGVEVSLEAADEGVVESLTKKGGDKGRVQLGRISEIVARIAKNRGWETDIVETDVIDTKPLVKGMMDDLVFIRYLSQYATSSKFPGTFEARLETSLEGGKRVSRLSFKPPQNAKLYRTYVVLHDKMGVVKSLEPQLSTLETASLGVSGLKGAGRDRETRKRVTFETSSTSHKNSVFLGKKVITPPGEIENFLLEATSKDQMKSLVEAYFSRLVSRVQMATMRIVGDPWIRHNDLIGIIVQTPQGHRYYTSGTWRVKEVTNEVRAGDFTTTLQITRNATDIGKLAPTGPKLTLKPKLQSEDPLKSEPSGPIGLTPDRVSSIRGPR